MSTNSIQQRYTLQAIERLKLRKQIETLFQTGEAFSVFPLRIVYRLIPLSDASASPVQVGFSIPKKRIKKAVGRNRVRRLLKEAWRLQKHPLYEAMPQNQQLHCFLIYTGEPLLTFEEAKKAVLKLQQKLIPKLKTDISI
ncbi:ribonuclease P protein component [Taibaiella lutea]|uniref:ribonuclease P protein component n=1 Tax=Taibaiella lutea TaxID=2608001 RepID=UPI00167FDEC3|nr:ribonuclease P protein component [Taibaiella lutea]